MIATLLSGGSVGWPALPALVILIAGVILVARIVLLVSRWSNGRPAAVPLLKGILAMPKRYLHDVHDITAREPRSARMHAMLAGGFLATLALSVVLHVVGIGGRVLAAIILLFLPVMLAGLVLQVMRRYPQRLARFSAGPFLLLPYAFLASMIFLFGLAVPVATGGQAGGAGIFVASLLGLAGLGWLAWQAGSGPMRHAVAGAVHLAAHPRPARFEGGSASGLEPLDLDADRLGAAATEDFSWNRLASYDACIQCGRCEAVCPAFAAGQPLNPKKLINDLAAGMGRPSDLLSYAGSPHPGIEVGHVAAGPRSGLIRHDVGEPGMASIHPETLWACTTCRACVYECPMTIEHVDAVIELRRFETLERGQTPGKGADALANLQLTDTVSGGDVAARLDFAVDLAIPVISAKGGADTLLFLGESAYDRRNQRSIRAFVQLLKRAGVDFAVLGAEERDTGDLARRLGDEATFQRLAQENVRTLARYSFRRIVTLDPHVLHSLRNEYPAFGGNYDVRHHSEVLKELLSTGRLSVARPVEARVTYHDPCYLGRYNGEIAVPRDVLSLIGADLREMARSGMRSSCCGGGGGAPLTDIPGKRRIPDVRMDHVRETGADLVVAACPFCTQMLEGVPAPHPAVTDIAELVLAAVEGEA